MKSYLSQKKGRIRSGIFKSGSFEVDIEGEHIVDLKYGDNGSASTVLRSLCQTPYYDGGEKKLSIDILTARPDVIDHEEFSDCKPVGKINFL